MTDETRRPSGGPEDAAAGPRDPNDPMHSSEAEEAHGLTMVGAMTIELYQKQGELAERAWFYMSLYSGILFVLSLALLVFGKKLDMPEWWYWLFPAFGYLAFAVGNYKTLCHSLAELRLMRGLAITHSGLELRGFKASTAERFHLLLLAFVLGFFLFAVYTAYQ